MYIRVIDWGEQAVLKAWWCWWGGKGWCDLSGCNSIQCHITAQLNHLRSWVDQVIMPLPVGPESITRWMWPLQTYRVTAMFHFHLFLWIVGTFIWPVFFCTDFTGSETRICYFESVPGSSFKYNIVEAVTEHRNTVPLQKLDINQKIEKLCSILCVVQNPFNTGHSGSRRLSLQQFSQWQWCFL